MKFFPLLFGLLATCAAGAAGPSRPNVLFIFSDDQSYKTLGCYPEAFPFVRTPHLDGLAARGVRFHASYLGSWCMPSRATMLTGRLPHGIESMTMAGVYPSSTYDPAQCRFWPAELRRQGYQTAQIGKWHTGTDAGWGRDWDHQIVWNRPKHPANADAYYEDQILAVNGVELTVGGYPADNYTRWAVDYIRGANRDPAKPWYLWLCYGNVHRPNVPAARHAGRYRDAAVPVPADILPPRAGKPAYLEQMQEWTRDATGTLRSLRDDTVRPSGAGETPPGATFADWVRRVNECVPALDEGVGQLLAALRETGQLENTVIVFAADQGYAMGEHGLRAKQAPYDASYRSPLIVSWPRRFATGAVCAAPVSGADLVATFLSLTQATVPWPLHGRDLTPLLEKPDFAWPHPCLYEHMGQKFGSETRALLAPPARPWSRGNFPPYVALVHEGFKLVRYLAPGIGDELYDLRRDPEELDNLAAAPAHAARRTALHAALAAELHRTAAPFAAALAARD
jgi:arylsulfatase A-like enzyme